MNTFNENRPDNIMSNNLPNHPFEQRARELYHNAARNLDPATAGRLRVARREALADTGTRQAQHHVARWLVPSSACAAIALAALLVWPSAPRPVTETPAAVVASSSETDNALPPDPDQADPNLYQNLDFYGWLAANNHSSSAR